MAKKNWSEFPKKFRSELNEVGGIIGAAGVGMAALGTVLAAPYIAVISGVIGSGAFIYAAVKSNPDVLAEPDDVLGKQLDLNELANLTPPVMGVGIVGATRVGKSTLLECLSFKNTSGIRTDELYAVVVKLQTTGNQYIALIDGAGQEYGQQFDIVVNSDFLAIVLDHNESNSSISIDDNRLESHKQFVEQIERHLKKKAKRKRVHFVLNKNDLWGKNTDLEKERMTKWYESIVKNFEQRNLSEKVTSAIHSNLESSCVTNFNNSIIEEV